MTDNLNAVCSQVNNVFIAGESNPINNPCMDDLLKRVEYQISQKRWTWADFARALETTDQRVYNWRKRGVPKSEVDRIADVLEVSTDYLLKGTDVTMIREDEAHRSYADPDKDADLLQALKRSGVREPAVAFTATPRRDKGGDGDELRFVGRMDAWDSNTPLDEDEVELPLFREVELAAGAGQTQVVENHGAKLRFAKSTLARANVLPENAACAFVRGNSMEPVMPDGTCVGVNTADKTIRDGEIYAIDHDGMLRVKFLHRRPGGGIKIVSQNSLEHPAEEVTSEEMAASIRVIGRVFWWSVLR